MHSVYIDYYIDSSLSVEVIDYKKLNHLACVFEREKDIDSPALT